MQGARSGAREGSDGVEYQDPAAGADGQGEERSMGEAFGKLGSNGPARKALLLIQWLTKRAIRGIPPLSSAECLAQEYLRAPKRMSQLQKPHAYECRSQGCE